MQEKQKKINPSFQTLLKKVGIRGYSIASGVEAGGQKKDVQKEILTTEKMKALFGASYKDIVYYNFDTATWNRPNYLGFTMGNQRIDALHAKEMKQLIEKEPEMQNLEVVASVTKSVPDEQYPGNGRVTPYAKYKRASNIIGTLVLRDKITGKVLSVPACWLGVEAYPKMSVAAFYGADGFAYKLANDGYLRDKFVSELVRQIQR